MDLTYLLDRYQASLTRIDAAACAPSRSAHHGLAQGYFARIEALSGVGGLVAAFNPATTR